MISSYAVCSKGRPKDRKRKNTPYPDAASWLSNNKKGLYMETHTRRASILVVDDSPVNIRLLSKMLAEQDYKVRAAIDGQRALASATSNPPDLILLDIMMPNMDGYEVCRRLKADLQTRDIPIIFISALNATEDKVKAFAAGGVDFVTKPLQIEEVQARVTTHLALHDLRQGLERELAQREAFIAQLDAANTQLQREISERQHAEVALELSREHFRTVADFTYNWEYWMGAGGYPVYISPSCQRVTGYRREAFQKDPSLLANIVHPDNRAMWLKHLNHDFSDPQTFSFRLRITMPDGETRWLGHSCQPVYNREGQWVGRRASNWDITEQVQAEEQLKQYAAELESQNAELDAFSHTVAHDLQNPLASLIGFSQLLNADSVNLPPEQISEGLDYIGQNARKMVNIINELLLLASVRKLDEIDIEPLDMVYIVIEAQTRLHDMLTQAQVEIILPEMWPIVWGYAPWIEEVWINYISNAIKYGGRPEESIPPRIELGFDILESTAIDNDTNADDAPFGNGVPFAADNLWDDKLLASAPVRFWVKDNGPGLSLQDCEQLFTQFTRLHQAHAKGHGLGLSIARRIVEKLGGEVGVESELGKGSTFWFSLPETTFK